MTKLSKPSVVADRLDEIAAEVRDHPGRFTPRAEVKTAQGAKLQTRQAGSPRAAAWGMWGFLERAFPGEESLVVGGGVPHPAAAALAVVVGTSNLAKWADEFGRTSADVAAAFSGAAALIREKGAKA